MDSDALRNVLHGQTAPLIDGQVAVLFSCPARHHQWLMKGQRALVDLTDEEVQLLASQVHASLDDLPECLCPACSTLAFGGWVSIDEYLGAQGIPWGYGFAWEGNDPPAHYIVALVNYAWILRHPAAVPEAAHPGLVLDTKRAEAVIAWLEELTLPPTYQPHLPADLNAMTAAHPPAAHLPPGTSGWQWLGAMWGDSCPALGGDVIVSLFYAAPAQARLRLPEAVRDWRRVAALIHRSTFPVE